MKTSWALQDAKNRFDELVDTSLRDGPQIVTRRGTPVVVVMAADEWKKRGKQKPKNSLVQFLRNSPLRGLNLDLTRNPDTGRKVEL